MSKPTGSSTVRQVPFTNGKAETVALEIGQDVTVLVKPGQQIYVRLETGGSLPSLRVCDPGEV